MKNRFVWGKRWLKRLRAELAAGQGGGCFYCGRRMAPPDSADDPSRLTLDHIVPRADGGGTNRANLVAACRRCNQRKSDAGLHPAYANKEMLLRVFPGGLVECHEGAAV